jgi:predicted nucleotidyltransferase component of viral defense system
MIEQADFQSLVEAAMAISGHSQMRPVIEKELLHYDLLFTLDKENLLDQLTFQGGTSLRLCHGAPRFSEDLDFTGGHGFSSQQLLEMKECIEHYIGKRYDLEVIVKTPAELKHQPEYRGLQIDKWQIAVMTAPEQKHLPKQRIKIEVANIPSYSREPQALQLNYDFLPDGYSDTLIMTETLDEVMADKLISLINCHNYVRHRDIWDLRWLKQQGAQINMTWLINKLSDYRIEDYLTNLDIMWQRMPEIIHSTAFKNEMIRFIPTDVQERTLAKEKFFDYLSKEIRGLFAEVKQRLNGVSEDEYRM